MEVTLCAFCKKTVVSCYFCDWHLRPSETRRLFLAYQHFLSLLQLECIHLTHRCAQAVG